MSISRISLKFDIRASDGENTSVSHKLMKFYQRLLHTVSAILNCSKHFSMSCLFLTKHLFCLYYGLQKGFCLHHRWSQNTEINTEILSSSPSSAFLLLLIKSPLWRHPLLQQTKWSICASQAPCFPCTTQGWFPWSIRGAVGEVCVFAQQD